MSESRMVPLSRAWNRVEIELQDSETAGFHSLLYVGELIVKAVAVVFCAGIQLDPDRRGYAIEHKLVRGSGVGEHVAALEEMLTGPTYEVLHPGLRALQRQLMAKNPIDSLEMECLTSTSAAMAALGLIPGDQAPSNTLRAWFHWFVQIRNKTRGHGAQMSTKLATAYKDLRRALEILSDRLEVFRIPWVYVRRNLSGKFRVVPIGGDSNSTPLPELKSGIRKVTEDGVYIVCAEQLFLVRLCLTDVDLSDFYLPNGSFQNGKCEFLSLISGLAIEFDGARYLAPTTPLPISETEGRKELDVIGDCFTNIPSKLENYIERRILEAELKNVLIQSRHEIASLSGPGGAGKTSLALQVCHELAKSRCGRFAQIIWFSARDIDLMPSGPKIVKPQGLSLKDFSRSYVDLVGQPLPLQKGFKPEEFLANELANSTIGPTLFVFDNFETVGSQGEMFEWIDTHIRSPNKVLVTTRTREFSGDRPIILQGMEEDEARALVQSTSSRLGITHLLTRVRIDELIRESGGHPYVLRILLGEIASRGVYVAPERVVAEEGRLLTALFERTYSRLSPAAQLVFLVVASWKSLVPVFALGNL